LSAATKRRARPPALRYIETSALLAALMEEDGPAADSLAADGVIVASALTLGEANRILVVARASGRLDARREQRIVAALQAIHLRMDVIQITTDILRRLGRPFPVEPVRALDAIHLASIEALDEDPHNVVVVTRDKRIEANARAFGYAIE